MQLMRLRPAFDGADVIYVTVRPTYRDDVSDAEFRVVPDATRWNKVMLLAMATKILWMVATIRPDVVISTGAAPGYFAIKFGNWFGAKTCWVDSMGNTTSLSLSGRKTRGGATLVLSQWNHVAEQENVEYAGSVL